MSITRTSTQTRALNKDHQETVRGVKIGFDIPVYYCDSLEPVTLASQVYTPRELKVGPIKLDAPGRSNTTVSILDLDKTLGVLWATNKLTGIEVTITEAIWSDGAWEVITTLPWTCNGAKRTKDGRMQLSLYGGSGLARRAGLEVASRADWRYAPEPGEVARVGAMIIQV